MLQKTLMTAREAADRIAARPRKPPQEEGDCEGSPYVCENCGSTEFHFIHLITRHFERTETLDCTCEKEADYAGQRTLLVTMTASRRGFLDAEHRCNDWDDEEEGETETEQTEYEIECATCLEESDGEESWDTEDSDTEEPVTDQDFEVRCHNCDQEVEFGWSHSDRGGRIWPVESVDFNPWKSFPEARFIEDWKRRGWRLRPSNR